MPKFSYRFTAHSTASAEELFDRIHDAPSWPSWTKMVPSARWEVPGRSGPGATRVMGSGPIQMRETVLAEERPSRHEYSLPDNPVATNYRARVTFTPAASGGTDVAWAGTFDALPVVGHAQLAMYKFIVGRLTRDLARHP